MHDSADMLSRCNELDLCERFPKLINDTRIGNFLGIIDADHFAIRFQNLIGHVGGSLNEIDVLFVFETLLHNFHMQHAQKTTAETETEGVTCLRLK